MNDHHQASAVAKAVHSSLTNNLAVQNILGEPARLYDHPPEDPIYPYLTYGPMRSEDVGGDVSPMTAHSLTLHIWSRYAGRAETLDGLSAVSAALENGNLHLNTANLISSHTVFTDHFRAPDGRTLHGIVRMQITTQPLTE